MYTVERRIKCPWSTDETEDHNNKMNNYQNDSPLKEAIIPTKMENRFHSSKAMANSSSPAWDVRSGDMCTGCRRPGGGGREGGGCQGAWASRWDNLTAACSVLLQLLRKANLNLIFWKFSKRVLISSGRIGKKSHEKFENENNVR